MLGLDEVFSREQLNRLPGRGLAQEEQRRSYRRVPASRLGRPARERVMVEKQLITQEDLQCYSQVTTRPHVRPIRVGAERLTGPHSSTRRRKASEPLPP